jgi:hypothetical protein
MAEKVVNGRQALPLAIDLSFAAASYPVSAAEERSVSGQQSPFTAVPGAPIRSFVIPWYLRNLV